MTANDAYLAGHTVSAAIRDITDRKRAEDKFKGLLESAPDAMVIVEDNPANAQFMQDLLGAYENIELVTAPSAEIGIALARSRQPEVKP